jgi:hypothetical protein
MKNQTELMVQQDIVAIEEKKRLQDFTSRVNKKPNPKSIKTNRLANNSKYLPIADIEMRLDSVFDGLWETRNFTTSVIVNEVVGHIELRVFHPVAHVWITRIGSAAVQIKLRAQRDASGNKISADVLDVSKKIVNTLQTDYPHLKAECIKNAAKSLGKFFGRDLNREEDLQYVSLNFDSTERESAHERLLK